MKDKEKVVLMNEYLFVAVIICFVLHFEGVNDFVSFE